MSLKKKIERDLVRIPGGYGITREMRKIPRRTVIVIHEHTAHTTPRYNELGGVANRATRRAYARGRGRLVGMPAPTLLPYERPRVGTSDFEAQMALYARSEPVAVYR